MRDPNNPCLFCNTNNKEYIFENDLAFATFDSYPVSRLHVLIIPKRHIKNYFELSNDELIACNEIILLSKKVCPLLVPSCGQKPIEGHEYKRKIKK